MVTYAPDVQKKLAAELATFGPPCPRDIVIEGCSAAHRFTIDYGQMRNQTRAIEAK